MIGIISLVALSFIVQEPSGIIEAVSDTDRFRITPQIETNLDLHDWRIEISGDGKPLDTLNGTGALDSSYVLALKELGLLNIGTYQTITFSPSAVSSTASCTPRVPGTKMPARRAG